MLKKNKILKVIFILAFSSIGIFILMGRFKDKSNKLNVSYKETVDIVNFGENFDYSWIDNNPYVAHAFGGIEGKSYTNSLEAFQYN